MNILHLFENFNTTNQTSPYFEAHSNYAKPVGTDRCEKITLLEKSQRCEYVKSCLQCSEHVFLINYNRFFYCNCDANDLLRITCIILILVCCALQFWLIYVTTNDFFVPVLQNVSRILNLNEYVAGATILALGNNASDLISTFFTVDSRARHIYTDSMSVSLFNVLTSAVIMWITPFSIDGSFFLREFGFVLLYVSYVDFMFKIKGGIITIKMAASMFGIYIVYIIVIILDEYIKYLVQRALSKKNVLNTLSAMSLEWNLSTNPEILFKVYETPNKRLFKQFIEAFDLLDWDMFNRRWTVFKIWAMIKFPTLILIRLFIPQMSIASETYKWSKLLCCIQISLTTTAIIFFIVKFLRVSILGLKIPIIVIIALCLTPFSVLAFCKSRTDVVPRWYVSFNILGGAAAMFTIFLISNELISSLETLGITLNRSHTFIGCTLYTWGTGLSDMLANVAIARKGYPRMAFSACLGSTILGTFTAICVPILYRTIKQGVIVLNEGTVGETTSILLIISLITLVLYGITTHFMLRRTGALIGISLYIIFLIFVVSSEFELTHAFGTEHSLDRGHIDERFLELERRK